MWWRMEREKLWRMRGKMRDVEKCGSEGVRAREMRLGNDEERKEVGGRTSGMKRDKTRKAEGEERKGKRGR